MFGRKKASQELLRLQGHIAILDGQTRALLYSLSAVALTLEPAQLTVLNESLNGSLQTGSAGKSR
jgi:hypothetical protein